MYNMKLYSNCLLTDINSFIVVGEVRPVMKGIEMSYESVKVKGRIHCDKKP